MLANILNSIINGKSLNKEEALKLLQIENTSEELYKVFSLANKLTRSRFNNKGFIFAQIGINVEPCSADCKFCSMGKSHYSMDQVMKKSITDIINEVKKIIAEGIDDLFLMTTADYPLVEYFEIGQRVKNIIPDDVRLVANIGDFKYDTAVKLKEIGFTGVYHINRLREGIDTTIQPEIRIKTLDAIKKAGLEFYYCIEPIGPEHKYEEIIEEMFRARDYDVDVMAVIIRG